MMGHDDGLWNAPWPDLIEGQIELARDEEVEVVIQVNGRVRGKLKVSAGIAEKELVTLAMAEHFVSQHINGKRVVKQIFVPDKLLNLVVA